MVIALTAILLQTSDEFRRALNADQAGKVRVLLARLDEQERRFVDRLKALNASTAQINHAEAIFAARLDALAAELAALEAEAADLREKTYSEILRERADAARAALGALKGR